MLRSMVPLVFLLVLLLSALTEPVPDVFVEAEHDAVLQCDNVQHGQHHCNATTWILSYPKGSRSPEEFITQGKMHPDFRYKDRFSLTESCSLVIKGAQIMDGQQFLCKQYRSGQEISQTSTMLSVVSLEEYDSGTNCYVSSPHRCSEIQVRWLYNDTEITEDHLTTHKYICGATLQYHNSTYSTLQRELFACEIIFGDRKHTYKLKSEATEKSDKTTAEPGTKQDQTQTKPGLSQDQTRGDETTEATEATEATPHTGHTEGLLIRNVLVSVGLLALLLSVAALLLYARVKGSRAPERSHSNVNREGAVIYENVGVPSVSVRVRSHSYEN